MKSFGGQAWDPPGRRWIAQLHLTDAALDLGDRYAEAARAWWQPPNAPWPRRPFEHVMKVLPRQHRHINLAWTNVPVSEVSPDQLAELISALVQRAARHPRLQLTIGPAVVNTLALELYIQPNEALTALRDDLAAAFAEVLGPAEPRTKTWRGHTALAYCQRALDAEGLQNAMLRAPGPTAGYLAPATELVDHVLLAATDPWDPDGVFWVRPVWIPLAADATPRVSAAAAAEALDAAREEFGTRG